MYLDCKAGPKLDALDALIVLSDTRRQLIASEPHSEIWGETYDCLLTLYASLHTEIKSNMKGTDNER